MSPFGTGGGGGGGGLSGVTITGTAASGQVPVASSSTAGAWAYPPGFEIVYAQITSNANITDTSEATATALITAGPATYDGGAVLLEFFTILLVPDTNAAGDFTIVTLFEGSTQLTRLASVRTVVTAANCEVSVVGKYRFTPTAGSHTYKVCGFVPSTTGTPTISAGLGGTGALSPAYCRVTKV